MLDQVSQRDSMQINSSPKVLTLVQVSQRDSMQINASPKVLTLVQQVNAIPCMQINASSKVLTLVQTSQRFSVIVRVYFSYIYCLFATTVSPTGRFTVKPL